MIERAVLERRSARRAAALVAAVLLTGARAVAGGEAGDTPWTWEVTELQWGVGLRGRIEPAAGTPALAARFSDRASRWEVALSLRVAARRGPWALVLEPFYADFDRAVSRGTQSWVQVDSSQVQFALAGTYRLVATRAATLDAVVGARFNRLNAVLSATGETTQSASVTWTDPFAGARLAVSSGARWTWWLEGDAGGFGVGARSAWSASGRVGYRVARPTSLVLGYGVIATDYRGTLHGRRLLYDVRIHGPSLGVSLVF